MVKAHFPLRACNIVSCANHVFSCWSSSGPAALWFLTSDVGGAFWIAPGGYVFLNFSNGPQLFTWPTTAPTFVPGYYTGFTPSGGDLATISDVTISSVTTSPEPTSLALRSSDGPSNAGGPFHFCAMLNEARRGS